MIGHRIRLARKQAGLSLRELSDKVSVSHTAIDKYEKDILIPTSDILLQLAKVMGIKTEYFFRPETPTLDKIEYRDIHQLNEKSKSIITAKIIDQIERRIELENLFPICSSNPFTAPTKLPSKIKGDKDAEVISLVVRQQWELGANPIPALIDLLENNGIRIFGCTIDENAKFSGLSATINQMPIIVYNNNVPGDVQRFIVAHELCHVIFGDRISDSTTLEDMCDRFAGSFLLPQEIIMKIIGAKRNNIELMELMLLKQEYGISMAAILNRIFDLEIITEDLYNKIRRESKKQGWDKQEPGNPYPKESSRIFDQMLFRALAEDIISESKAAELKGMTIAAFRSLRAMEVQHVSTYQIYQRRS